MEEYHCIICDKGLEEEESFFGSIDDIKVCLCRNHLGECRCGAPAN
jgi:hypothetical protein